MFSYIQECHEQIRLLSQEVGVVVKEEGGENDMIQRIKASSFFAPIHDKIEGLLDPKLFIGRAPHQVSTKGEVHLINRLDYNQAMIRVLSTYVTCLRVGCHNLSFIAVYIV